MPTEPRTLGILKPLGGGDPVPLMKEELTVGRRRTCDICLDFENVSGKHCILKMENGVWHVRDLGSTNGTTINGARLTGERGVMPDDEVGISSHLFTIDYEPVGSVMSTKALLEEELSENRPRRSLMELAGLETERDHVEPRPRRPSARDASHNDRLDTAVDEPAPSLVTPTPMPEPRDPSLASDEDYFKLFEEEVERDRS